MKLKPKPISTIDKIISNIASLSVKVWICRYCGHETTILSEICRSCGTEDLKQGKIK